MTTKLVSSCRASSGLSNVFLKGVGEGGGLRQPWQLKVEDLEERKGAG